MSRALYALAQWWLSVLPVDEAGQRAFDETLADWRREAAKAGSPSAGFVVSMRAVFSVLRCVAGVSLREVSLIGQSGVLTRVFLWSVAYLVIVTVIVQLSPNIRRLSTISRIYTQVALVASFLPIALLLATGFGGRRTVPGLGLALGALLIGFPLLGWGVPMANRAFLDANPARLSSPSTPEEREWLRPWKPGDGLTMAMEWQYSVVRSPSPPRTFSNDLTIWELGVKVAGGPEANGWSAIRWLSFFGAYLGTCALVPILASVLRRRTALVRYALVAITAAMLYYQPWLTISFGEFSIVWWLGAFWIPVAWMALCLVVTKGRDVLPGAAAVTGCQATS